MKIEALYNEKIAILGLGIEGLATAKYFLQHDIPFSVLDEKDEESLAAVGPEWSDVLQQVKQKHIPTILGAPFSHALLEQFSVVIRSPGISPHTAFLQGHTSLTVTSQTKLFLDNCPAKVIGVTGTKGKGTTSSLVYEMLKEAGFDAYIGGNIGQPPISFLDILNPQSFVVLEMSSFQLQDIEKSPEVAIMLMVTSEHLDYHKDTEEYVEAKRNIIRFQTSDDMAILNIDYPATASSQSIVRGNIAFVSRYQEVSAGCFVRDNDVIIRTGAGEERIIAIEDILLPGAHNLENVCAAVMAAHFLKVPIAAMRYVLQTFKGLEHRLELVSELGGVRYYDDSFSTVPETAIAAIQAFTMPEILILGGSSKNSDFTELREVISSAPNIKAIIGIGEEWEKIKEGLEIQDTGCKIIEGLKTMEDVVRICREISEPGDVVLLSPACASFDMFKNYKDRGEQFRKCVGEL